MFIRENVLITMVAFDLPEMLVNALFESSEWSVYLIEEYDCVSFQGWLKGWDMSWRKWTHRQYLLNSVI